MQIFDYKRSSNLIEPESGKSQMDWLGMTELPKIEGVYLLTFKKNH